MRSTAGTVEQALIAPRYLAGGGDPGWVTVPLHRACGWSYGHDPLMPRVILTSPDQLTQLLIDPDPDDPWWTIRHARNGDKPAWAATFGARTPVEIIAAFTDALTDPAKPADTGADPYAPLRKAGWDTPRHLYGLASPDGVTCVEHLGTAGRDMWTVETAVIESPTIWRAHFTGTTPSRLITAFTRSLAEKTPVARDPNNIPGIARDRMSLRTRRVPAADVASALERRVSALAARHTAPPAAASAPHVPPPRRTR
ncbi:DUF317 domain-containing protein [Streptomyces niveus]|uniref:DUF317 domain-containing protein n=1 Tax=Streptomyces niveus TaxID=193462 RepID=UPI0003C5A9E8|nr:DUF317 domain-containing protein [Streptomyces niveus]EST31648.1 hypothetical protein M877_06625 [Streptomyces niveus NCIMB 11891]